MLTDKIHRLLSRPSKFLDLVGQKALRFYLYRENAYFNPDLNGEHFLLNQLLTRGVETKSIFDIGANEGRWSARVRTIWACSDIHLFEPIPSIVERLEQRFAADDHIHVHPYAIGGQDGEVSIHENNETTSHSFVTLDLQGGNGIAMRSGENAFKIAGIDRLNLCKIDAEGYDLLILASMESLLEKQKIDIIQFEHYALTFAYGRSFSSISAMFQRHGYRLGKIHPRGLKEVRYGENDWSYQVGPNFCAMAPSHASIFDGIKI